MRMMGYCILGGAAVVSIVGAEQRSAMEQRSRELQEGLSTQVRILSSIADAKSAEEAVEPLAASMRALRRMKEGIKEAELWIYLDNTPGVKFPIIIVLENLMVQLQRIEKASYFGNTRLRDMLSPMCGKK